MRAVFLDRDGVINRKPPAGQYVTRWEDFHILPGVAEGVSQLNRGGFSVIVVTNQRCVAKGLITVADLEKIHQRMRDSLARAGAIIDGIYCCPHEIEPSCNCRKPAPGMLLDAARSRGIELSASWMIGDSNIDVEAGKNAGCRTARLLARNNARDESRSFGDVSNAADIVAASLLDAVQQILQLQAAVVDSFRAAPVTKIDT